MLFQKKVDRAMEWSAKRSGRNQEQVQAFEEGGLPSMEELKAEANQDMDLEKGDFLAMLISALIVIVPVGVLVLLFMCGFMFFL